MAGKHPGQHCFPHAILLKRLLYRDQRPASGTRNEKNPTRLKPEIGWGSGLITNFFRVSIFLFGSGSGLKTNFFSEKYLNLLDPSLEEDLIHTKNVFVTDRNFKR